jgi:hypothetical protein
MTPGKRWQQERDEEIGSDPVLKQAVKRKSERGPRRGQAFTPPDYGDAVVYDRLPTPTMNVCHDV